MMFSRLADPMERMYLLLFFLWIELAGCASSGPWHYSHAKKLQGALAAAVFEQ